MVNDAVLTEFCRKKKPVWILKVKEIPWKTMLASGILTYLINSSWKSSKKNPEWLHTTFPTHNCFQVFKTFESTINSVNKQNDSYYMLSPFSQSLYYCRKLECILY